MIGPIYPLLMRIDAWMNPATTSIVGGGAAVLLLLALAAPTCPGVCCAGTGTAAQRTAAKIREVQEAEALRGE